MPKELHEIREFSKGMITSVSEGDIPDNAAQLSINIDPIAEFGVLKALPEDQILSTNGFEDSNTGTEINAPASRINFINDSGIYHGITMSSTDGTGSIIHISDIYGTPSSPVTLTSSINSSQNTFTSVVNNKELHIGTGSAGGDTPIWAGMIEHPHFSDMFSTEVQIADADIGTTSVFNYVNDIEADKTSIYGINKENHRIYKFDIDDERMVTNTILDCERIHCFTLWTPEPDDPTETLLYLMVEDTRGPSHPDYDEYNDRYRIMVLDSNLLVLYNNIYYQIVTRDENGGEKLFRIGSTDGMHGDAVPHDYMSSSHTGRSIKRIGNTLWILIGAASLRDSPFSYPISNYHYIDRGSWILNVHISEDYLVSQEATILDLTIRTPWGMNHQVRSPSVNVPNAAGQTGGVFGVPADDSNNLPTTAYYEDGKTPLLYPLKLVKIEGYTDGVGVICSAKRGLISTNNRIPVIQTGQASSTYYSRLTSTYVCIHKDFAEVSDASKLWYTVVDGDKTEHHYQSSFFFNTDPHTGSEAISASSCKLYHFGNRALSSGNITSDIDTSGSTGGWLEDTYGGFYGVPDMSDFASSYSVNEYYSDSYGALAMRRYGAASQPLDEWYLRSFLNPNASQVGIGYNGGDVGYKIVFTDDRLDDLVTGRIAPVSNTKLMFLLGESTISNPKFGKLEVASGNWYDAGSSPALTLTTLFQSDIEFTFGSNVSVSSTFFNSYRYFWAISFLYDGYQESPLSASSSQDASATAAADESFVINIKLSVNINNRISHVILYRGDSGGILATDSPLGYFRQVKTIPLDSRWSLDGDIFSYSVTDSGTAGISYANSSGLPENIIDVTPNYKLSTQLNSSHFIADVYSYRLGGQKSNYLLKSLPYNYDVFDWTKDFLQLPTTPVALSSFKGRVYVFDDNNTYRIEPNNLYIEDTFEGSGCIGHDSVVVTEYGMFYCDRNNVYKHDGNMPYPIADAILPTWTNLDFNTYTPIMGFDSKRKSIIISVYDGTDFFEFLVYNTFRKRWDIVTKTNNTLPVTALFATKEGHAVYVAHTYNVSDFYYKLFSHTTDKRAWSWSSKELDMGTATLNKSFLNTVLIGNNDSGTDLSEFSVIASGGAIDRHYNSVDDKYYYSGKDNRQSKTINYVFTDVDGSIEIDSIGTAYRRL